MPKRTSVDNSADIRVVIVTLDQHLGAVAAQVEARLRKTLPGLTLSLHAAAQWNDPEALARCHEDIARGDIIFVSMLFMEEHINPVREQLQARRAHCDAMIGCLSSSEIVRLTRMGEFRMGDSKSTAAALFAKLRKLKKPSGKKNAGAQQMAMLRRVPQLLRFIPGTAQDVRAYFLVLQYWLAGSQVNITNLVRLLISRYADGSRQTLRESMKVEAPVDYPETGLYHPRLNGVTDRFEDLPLPESVAGEENVAGTIGLLLMRSYVLAGNTGHYDGVIEALERRGHRVVPAFAAGLDARPALEAFFMDAEANARVDTVVSLTGFSLVGGPAYNDSEAAQKILADLDVPYISTLAVEFQSLEDWQKSSRGLLPIETAMMVAIPELDGATAPMLFGGRSEAVGEVSKHRGYTDMIAHTERVDKLASRVSQFVNLRHRERHQRKIAIVIYDFPPNSGATGSAAFLSVFRSLFNTLNELKSNGYDVEVPESVDSLRNRLLTGNAAQYGMAANVHALIGVDDYVSREPYLDEIEQEWGSAPGRHQSDGSSILVLGAQFGNVFVGVQPAFGYEGDPMRLLFERGFAPTHAFSAFYQYIREDFNADAVLHFGTHGALEFMPGKQVGMSQSCWPERMIGSLPNFYFYAVNNPSEGTIAKRRSAATLLSYLTPSVTEAGLYRGLLDLKNSVEQWRTMDPADCSEEHRTDLAQLIQAQAAEVELAALAPAWSVGVSDSGDGCDEAEREISTLAERIREVEYSLIPHGLHVIGEPSSEAARIDMLSAVVAAQSDETDYKAADETDADMPGSGISVQTIRRIVHGEFDHELDDQTGEEQQGASTDEEQSQPLELRTKLIRMNRLMSVDHEIQAMLHALDGGYVMPCAGGDLLHNHEVLPTGRNIHGFDPYRLPTAFAVKDGARQASLLLESHMESGNQLPESIAMVLWGTDNLKTGGGPIGQVLALIGATPRHDNYGRLSGADLIPLEQLGRPRIDVLVTLSGIFRDLLPLQIKLLADAVCAAAKADEPLQSNFIRKHALEYQSKNDCSIEVASLRVFGNEAGSYGSNVNQLIDSGCWGEEDELADTFLKRKCFAYGTDGQPVSQSDLLGDILSKVELSYQNLDSVEIGITTIDHYFDTLGGISRSAQRARDDDQPVPVYIGDQTRGTGKVRTLQEQVALDARTRVLNPKWYEEMLSHGYEGVRQIESHVTNTVGWSATTGQVEPWVYSQMTETFLLDKEMRDRLARLNPTASARVANRLIEAHEREYWTPDAQTLDALREAGEELEDRLEGVLEDAAA